MPNNNSLEENEYFAGGTKENLPIKYEDKNEELKSKVTEFTSQIDELSKKYLRENRVKKIGYVDN